MSENARGVPIADAVTPTPRRWRANMTPEKSAHPKNLCYEAGSSNFLWLIEAPGEPLNHDLVTLKQALRNNVLASDFVVTVT